MTIFDVGKGFFRDSAKREQSKWKMVFLIKKKTGFEPPEYQPVRDKTSWTQLKC